MIIGDNMKIIDMGSSSLIKFIQQTSIHELESYLDDVAFELTCELFPNYSDISKQIFVRIRDIPQFRKLRELSVDLKSKNIDNTNIDCLSMGMSGDFEIAIEEGASLVRVGSSIFGARDYFVHPEKISL